MHREREATGGGRSDADATNRFDASEARHRDVDHGHVGRVFDGKSDRLFAGIGLGHDGKLRIRFEDSPDSFAQDSMVVRNQDSRRHHSTPSSVLRAVRIMLIGQGFRGPDPENTCL
jgi:hypothetical protein